MTKAVKPALDDAQHDAKAVADAAGVLHDEPTPEVPAELAARAAEELKLPKWMEPRRLRNLAESMREIRADLQRETEKNVRWFQGKEGTEFFSWHDPDGNVLRQQLCFKDVVLEWDPRAGLRAAGLGGGKTEIGFGRGEGSILNFEVDRLAQAALEAARMLLTTSHIPSDVAAPMLTAIAQALRTA